jgi:ubiquinone/menaquinone biosynthesis C-methylase UbiE
MLDPPMATPWDRAAAAYVEEWVPRFVPYHLDLVHDLALRPGQRVLVVTAGPGAEVLAVARAVGEKGFVRATDASGTMIDLCKAQAEKAALEWVHCDVAEANDVTGGPWDAIVCAFGLWQIEHRAAALAAWQGALSPRGKVGIVTWGPPEADDPFEVLGRVLTEVEPTFARHNSRADAARTAMEAMFADAELSMVRHTIVRHVLGFPSAERFVRAMREGCTWRKTWEELGDVRMERVARAFYDWAGGPDAPLSFAPPAALAIAGLPGAELELAGRPSVKAPPSSRSL